ncbi:hypothetical protein PFISCL1PPCAC_14921, partial [Pristionchus fissidentatus]
TQLVLNEGNSSASCVPKECAGVPPNLKGEQINVTSSCVMLDDQKRECTFKQECKIGTTITSSTTTRATDRAVCE